jgi:hypothetical protein
MIPSEVAYKRTLQSAKRAIGDDLALRHFLLSLALTKLMTMTAESQRQKQTERKKISELAALGIVDLHLDDTYKLSNVGKVLVKELQKK